jgi:nitroreductase
MEALEAILTRRSIRQYTSRNVPEALVKVLLEAGMSAPSTSNLQPWHFVVIKDHRLLCEIPKFHPYSEMLKQAPLAILVCGDLSVQKQEGYMVQDCSAATQNILLAAHAKKLGAVWLGIYPKEARVAGIRKLFGLPGHILPVSLIAIGFPAEHKARENRFKPSRVHTNRWA